MTNEQLAALIRNGQRGHLLTLWHQVERFAAWQARRWNRTGNTRGMTVKDLMQVAFLALLSALDGYDPERGKFLTWYSYALKTAFSEALGVHTERDRRDPINYAVSLDAPAGEDDDDGRLSDIIPDPSDPFEETERGIWLSQLRAALDRQLDTLPPNQAEALRLRFYEGLTLKQCGERCGVNLNMIRERERKALDTLSRGRRAAELRAFVDGQTDFYNVRGIHGVERLVIHRENITKRAGHP